MSAPPSNWAGNLTYRARAVHHPTSLDELRRTVAHSDRVRAVGTRHSFNALGDTAGDLVDMTALPLQAEVDSDRRQVRVSGGARYGDLATYLHQRGLALHNLASLPHISVAGACATATHGSGDRSGNLATAVAAFDLVTAEGDLVELSEPGEVSAAVVGLGALGVVTALTLDVQPAYDVRQYVFENLPLASLDACFDAVFAAADSVSLFTYLRGDVIDQVWLKQHADAGEPADIAWAGARPADGPRHPILGLPPAHCTEQGGVPGPWHERLPHFRSEVTPSAGDELQSEYLVPRQHAASALAAVTGIRDRLAPALQVCEIRTVAADDLWLSPCYRRDTVGLHFTWVNDLHAVGPRVAMVEDHLAAYDARPHWGKVFTTAPETVRDSYPRAADFQDLRRRYDPRGKFGTDLLDALFPATG